MMREVYAPELLQGTLDVKAEYDRLYLEKCQEVNELEQKVEKYKSMAEIAVKQKHDIEIDLNCKKSLISALCLEIEDYKQTIAELAAEPLKGFIPDVEPPEELPESLWDSQAVTPQDILCLSSALKNLYEIHKTDSWLLYTKLCKVLEKKIEEYSKEEG